MAGKCSPVDWIFIITAMPVVATSAMAENHIKTNSIGLQLQVEYWYEQEGRPQGCSAPPFALPSEHNRITLHF